MGSSYNFRDLVALTVGTTHRQQKPPKAEQLNVKSTWTLWQWINDYVESFAMSASDARSVILILLWLRWPNLFCQIVPSISWIDSISETGEDNFSLKCTLHLSIEAHDVIACQTEQWKMAAALSQLFYWFYNWIIFLCSRKCWLFRSIGADEQCRRDTETWKQSKLTGFCVIFGTFFLFLVSVKCRVVFVFRAPRTINKSLRHCVQCTSIHSANANESSQFDAGEWQNI